MAIKFESKVVNATVVKEKEEPVQEKPKKRPKVLHGQTYKLTNHAKGYNLYLTVNVNEGKPFELFIDGSHTDATEWVKALARLISAMLRTEHFDLEFIAKELMKIHSDQGYHAGGKNGYVAGVVQHIGKTLLQVAKSEFKASESVVEPSESITKENVGIKGELCPKCSEYTLIRDGGCEQCTNCDYSKCG